MSAPLWRPTAPERCRLADFRRQLVAAGVPEADIGDYRSLHAFSIEEPSRFWRNLWDFAGVVGEPGSRTVTGSGMHGTRFFPDGRLNFAENLLRHEGDAEAVVGLDEAGDRDVLDRDALRGAVAAAAVLLRQHGLRPGDTVVALVPNRVDTLVLVLAVTALGGVWSSCSPDFGTDAALDRFRQLDARLFVACDGYHYGGKRFDVRDRVAQIASALPGLAATIVLPVLETDPDLAAIPGAVCYRRVLQDESPHFETRSFDDPLYVMFSSGTTGTPKCIRHGIGGTLLQQLKEHQLHCDLRDGDRILFYTTCGWMMWNWLVAGLASGATVVLYDGNPAQPEADRLLRIAEQERLTHLGLSPGLLDLQRQAGVRGATDHDLSALRCVLSTGSPLSDEGFRYVLETLAPGVHLASISGGTDIMGCFALGVPELPVHAGEIQAAGLGMAIAFVDDDGTPLLDTRGELVCTRPFPSMPLGFAGDEDGARYRAAYFDRWPDVWRHGDFGTHVDHGEHLPPGVVIHGRSDAVLNRGGVRIGTAELYRPLETMAEIVDAIAVTHDAPAGQRIVLFVVLAADAELDEDLDRRIRQAIRSQASPRHVPDRIGAVPELPRTRSGKLVELAVRDVIHGRRVANVGALANPEALDAFRDHPALDA